MNFLGKIDISVYNVLAERERCMSNNFLTQDDFLLRMKNIYGDAFDYSKVEYKHNRAPVILFCKEHKFEFEQAPRNALRGRNGCKYCSGRGWDKDDFLREASVIWGDNFDYSETDFKGMSYKVEFICTIHNTKLSQLAREHVSGIQACQKCKKEEQRSQNFSIFLSQVKEKYSDQLLFKKTDYIDVRTEMNFICIAHNCRFSETPQKILKTSHYKCPQCQKNKDGSLEELISLAKINQPFPERYDYSKTVFKGWSSKINIFCNYHNLSFSQKARVHSLGKRGCQKCRYESTKTPLERTLLYLNSLGVEYEENYIISDSMKVDVFLPSLDLAFVVDEDKKESTMLKKDTLTIYYLPFSLEDWNMSSLKIKKSISQKLLNHNSSNLYFTNKRNSEKKNKSTSSAVQSKKKAKKVSKKENGAPTAYPPKIVRDVVQGVNDLETLFPKISAEMVGDPTTVLAGSTVSQEWRCSLCGNSWKASPKSRTSYLLADVGCPDCAHKRAMKIREKSKLLKDIVPTLSDELKNNKDKENITYGSHKAVEWICEKGHIYELSANQRMNGRSCPYCAFRKVYIGYNNLGAVRPDLIDQVVNKKDLEIIATSNKVVEWKHITDDGVTHYWSTRVKYRVYYGHNCSVCSGASVQVGVNDFKTFLDKSGLSWSNKNNEMPEGYTVGSSKKVVLECLKHEQVNEMTDSCKNFSNGSRVCQDCKSVGDHFRSKGEQELIDYLEELLPDSLIETNVRRFKKYGLFELDGLVDNKIAFDYNGDYWHQEGVFKPIGYHKNKRKLVEDLGFIYIEIPEFEWINNNENSRKKIKEKLKNYIYFE